MFSVDQGEIKTFQLCLLPGNGINLNLGNIPGSQNFASIPIVVASSSHIPAMQREFEIAPIVLAVPTEVYGKTQAQYIPVPQEPNDRQLIVVLPNNVAPGTCCVLVIL